MGAGCYCEAFYHACCVFSPVNVANVQQKLVWAEVVFSNGVGVVEWGVCVPERCVDSVVDARHVVSRDVECVDDVVACGIGDGDDVFGVVESSTDDLLSDDSEAVAGAHVDIGEVVRYDVVACDDVFAF